MKIEIVTNGITEQVEENLLEAIEKIMAPNTVQKITIKETIFTWKPLNIRTNITNITRSPSLK